MDTIARLNMCTHPTWAARAFDTRNAEVGSIGVARNCDPFPTGWFIVYNEDRSAIIHTVNNHYVVSVDYE